MHDPRSKRLDPLNMLTDNPPPTPPLLLHPFKGPDHFPRHHINLPHPHILMNMHPPTPLRQHPNSSPPGTPAGGQQAEIHPLDTSPNILPHSRNPGRRILVIL